MNNENLILFNKLSTEKQRELSRRGGIASGKKRRAKAALKKRMIEIMRIYDVFEKLSDEEYADFKKWQKEHKRKSKG